MTCSEGRFHPAAGARLRPKGHKGVCAKSHRIGAVTRPMAAYAIYDQSATRSNPLRAQQQTLAALQALRPQIDESPKHIKTGLEEGIRHARLDLAYVLLRENQRLGAIKSVLPLLWEKTGWQSMRDVLSIFAAVL